MIVGACARRYQIGKTIQLLADQNAALAKGALRDGVVARTRDGFTQLFVKHIALLGAEAVVG